MGIKPKPETFGDDCLICYNAGETPYEFNLFLSDLSTGSRWLDTHPPAPNGRHIILQNDHLPCVWHEGPTTPCAIGWFPSFPPSPQLALLVSIDAGKLVFQDFQDVQCGRYFTNEIVNPVGTFYYGGFAMIATSAELLSAVQAQVTIPEDGTKFEVSVGPGGIVDVRIANEKHRINLIIQLDGNDF